MSILLSVPVVLCPSNRYGYCNGIRHGDTTRRSVCPYTHFHSTDSVAVMPSGTGECDGVLSVRVYEWMAQLQSLKIVSQAELLAIREACLWTIKTNGQVKI
ncbi:hypothetical protein AVEN_220039-1 [Araneus ventricosus]|uniref:Uncharacterized protein n=1 Tax=Araneus ventricosus TaxID=182803 RepID=A0A4Y2CQ86_ARAVE|nr:hypothetical protein AVEN_220039-1 [Araneus ventricosus]